MTDYETIDLPPYTPYTDLKFPSQIKLWEPKPKDGTSKSSRTESHRSLIIGGIIGIVALVLVLVTVIVMTVILTGSNEDSPNPTTPEPTTLVPITTTSSQTKTEGPTTPTTTVLEVPGEWQAWNPWGPCSTTCGRGIRERSRECSGTVCYGIKNTIQLCWQSSCPKLIDEYGIWSAWTAWEECVECKDGPETPVQRRTRACDKTGEDQKDCIGVAEDSRGCDVPQCPSCDRTCSVGSVDMDSCMCTCKGTESAGRVLTDSREPLNNVLISNTERRNKIVGVTSTYGLYTLNDTCLGAELVYRRIGYMPVTIDFKQPVDDVIMMKIVPLYIQREPRGGARLKGGCITLNCEAMGFPEPQYFEWFKDGMLLAENSFTNQKTLELKDISVNDTGLYYCRANTDYSAVYSRAAAVDVADAAENFCPSAIISSSTKLPLGCTHDEKDTLEVNRCLDSPCTTDPNIPCTGETASKCSATSYNLVEITCETGNFRMPVITSCGCVSTLKTRYYLVGVVISAHDNKGVPMAPIYVNDTQVEVTTVSGYFALDGEIEGPRLIIRIGATNRYAEHIEVVELNARVIDAQYLVIKVSERLPEERFDSSKDIVLSPGSQKFSEGFAGITISSNSLFYQDGSPYNGEAKIRIEIVDTRNTDADIAAPGDFSAIDEQGEDVTLISTGMFRLVAQADNGTDLNIGGKVKVSFRGPVERSYKDDSILQFSRTRLWSLDPTSGRWQFLSNFELDNDTTKSNGSGMRMKRQLDWGEYSSELDGISISRYWSNFDSIPEATCHSKVRFYENNHFDPENILTGSKVNVLTMENSHDRVPGNSVSSVRAYTDKKDDSQGYCAIHPCDSHRSNGDYNFHGYIVAEHDREPLWPDPDPSRFPSALEYSTDEHAIKVKYDLRESDSGPYYDWESPKWMYSSMCSNADINEPHFRFFKTDVAAGECADFTPPSTRRHLPSGEQENENWYSWRPHQSFRHFMFVKALVDWAEPTIVRAASYVGRVEDDIDMDEGESYGTRDSCTESKTVCVELKVSGPVTDGHEVSQGMVLTAFNLTLVNTTRDYRITYNPALLIHREHITNHGHTISMLLQYYETSYGSSFGIYHGSSKDEASDNCRQSIDNEGFRYKTPDMDPTKWAFRFTEINSDD